jgi:hypothetical protein
MCCPLDQINGRFIVQAIAWEEDQKSKEDILHLKGVYDSTPATFSDRISRYFQRLELAEKIAEIVDETFHLFQPIFQRYTNAQVYQTLRELHHGSHDIEHLLHSFCFLGDLNRMLSGHFFEYQDPDRTQLDYLRSISRVCHAVAHLFATAQFLNELKLCSLGKVENVVKYAPLFSLVGYGLWTISLVWQHHQGVVNDQFASDLSIQLGGFLFEACSITKEMESTASYASLLGKAGSIAGIIHAWFVVQRLMPNDKIDVATQFVMPSSDHESQDELSEEDCPHAHHPCHHHDHSHEHEIKFFAVPAY